MKNKKVVIIILIAIAAIVYFIGCSHLEHFVQDTLLHAFFVNEEPTSATEDVEITSSTS